MNVEENVTYQYEMVVNIVADMVTEFLKDNEEAFGPAETSPEEDLSTKNE